MFESLAEGIAHLNATVLVWSLIGALLGVMFGVLPGLGSVSAMAVILPLTYSMGSMSAFALLCAIYISSVWGGSVTAIVLGIPGDTGSVASVADGHALAKQGKPRYALGVSIFSSLLGSAIGTIALIIFLPVFSLIVVNIDATSYFWIIAIALLFVGQAVNVKISSGILSVALGCMLGTIGIDPLVGHSRYVFGSSYLSSGMQIIPLVLGMFGLTQMIRLFVSPPRADSDLGRQSDGRLFQGALEALRHPWVTLRASFIGIVNGIVPGLGAPSAALISYSNERLRGRADEPEFGKGNVRGLIAPEVSNSSTVAPSLVPTLTIGVPGTVSAAIFIGAMTLHGLRPGRDLIVNNSDVIIAIAALTVIGSLFLLPSALATAPWVARISKVPSTVLVGCITPLLILGAYSNRSLPGDIIVLLVVGVLGYVFENQGFSGIALLMGFILGPIFEVNLRRAVASSDGYLDIFISKPLHIGLIGVFVGLAIYLVYNSRKRVTA